jgi:hypothetical protein
MEAKKLTFVERLLAPTPGFFRTIRTTGLSLTAIGGSIIAAQVSLPAIVTTMGGYLIVAGGVMTAVAQATVEKE